MATSFEASPSTVLQMLMEADVGGLIEAGRHERAGERLNYRNGFCDRTLNTRLGSLQLRIPKLRQGSYFLPFLEPRKTSEKALVAVIQEAWIGGVSTRRVDDLQLVRAGGGGLPGGGAALQGRDTAVQRGGRGDAENEIDTLSPAEVQHFEGAIVAVGTEQDFDPRPVTADLAHQAAEKATHLLPSRPAGGAQRGGDGAALAVEHDDRLEAVCVVVSVK